MTFAIVGANKDQIIQVSDRRLTGLSGGDLLQEDFGKVGHLLCDDASVLYCFTGLATIREFNTSTWLMETLQTASKKDRRFDELIRHFADLATKHFKSNPDVLSLETKQRKLTVMLSGYKSNGSIVNVLISNFQDFVKFFNHEEAQPNFTVYCESPDIKDSENPTIIQAIGAFSALPSESVDELRLLLEKRAPHHAILGKSASIVLKVSEHHRSSGTVGKRLNFGRIDHSSRDVAYAGYVSDITEKEIPLLNKIDARTHGADLLIRDFGFSTSGNIVFPSVHRNALCPCGSGKKYKFCHRLSRK